MNPCIRCGKRREHAFHDPRARVYREDRCKYFPTFVECGLCHGLVHKALSYYEADYHDQFTGYMCPSCYEAIEAVTA